MYSFDLDDFSCLKATFYLQRALGFNIVQSYIPTALIVMVSWVSFWIDRRAVPARVALSFTTLVSLTTLVGVQEIRQEILGKWNALCVTTS